MSKRVAVCGIYFILCVANSGLYVGSSVDVHRRICTHFSQLKRAKHVNAKIQRTYNKYGAGTFVAGLLESVSSRDDLIAREQVWISSGIGTLNISERADLPSSQKGIPKSPEHRAKIGAANTGKTRPSGPDSPFFGKKRSPEIVAGLTGRNNPMFGRKASPETLAKMSASNTGEKNGFFGRHHTAETRALIGAKARERVALSMALIGKPFSDEHVAKISASLRILSDAQKKEKQLSTT